MYALQIKLVITAILHFIVQLTTFRVVKMSDDVTTAIVFNKIFDYIYDFFKRDLWRIHFFQTLNTETLAMEPVSIVEEVESTSDGKSQFSVC